MLNKLKRFIKTVTTIASFVLLLASIGAIDKGTNIMLGFVGALASMCWLWYAAYSAGWCYKFFYGEDE